MSVQQPRSTKTAGSKRNGADIRLYWLKSENPGEAILVGHNYNSFADAKEHAKGQVVAEGDVFEIVEVLQRFRCKVVPARVELVPDLAEAPAPEEVDANIDPVLR